MKAFNYLFLIALTLSPFAISAQNSDSFFKVPISKTQDLPAWAQLMYSNDPNVYEVSDLYISFYQENEFEKTTHTQNYKFWLKSV